MAREKDPLLSWLSDLWAPEVEKSKKVRVVKKSVKKVSKKKKI